jgi:hypothetical protein
MFSFTASLEIIGVNPYVFVPEAVLDELFQHAGYNKGPIPVRGEINGHEFTQTLVRYAGHWRLYVNTKMLKNSPKRIGESVTIKIYYDPRDRSLALHPKLKQALNNDSGAKKKFDSLSPSRKNEINRYIHGLKSEDKIRENILRAIQHLNGHGRFVGRDPIVTVPPNIKRSRD